MCLKDLHVVRDCACDLGVLLLGVFWWGKEGERGRGAFGAATAESE